MIHGDKRFQMSRRSDWLWREILDFSSPWLTATRDFKNSQILSLRQIWDAFVGPSSQWLTATKGCQKHPKKFYLPKNTYFFGIDPSYIYVKKLISRRHDSRWQEVLKVSSQWLTVTRDFKFLVAMIHGDKRF